MSALEKIKVAAAQLDPDEQYELFRWWIESDSFKQRHLAELKREIAIGLQQFDSAHYQTYNASDDLSLAQDIGRSGRERMAQPRQNPKA